MIKFYDYSFVYDHFIKRFIGTYSKLYCKENKNMHGNFFILICISVKQLYSYKFSASDITKQYRCSDHISTVQRSWSFLDTLGSLFIKNHLSVCLIVHFHHYRFKYSEWIRVILLILQVIVSS